ncbi:MAG: hypothetical protein JWO38_2996 [Gemmataceae bacterium]|nr:hypothetical protein [Gemmataceae bacterium]
MIVRLPTVPDTAAEFVRQLGDIPLDRIRIKPPMGEATEGDLVKALNGHPKLLCELVDGVLVEKALGALQALLAAYLIRKIGDYADDNDLGLVLGADGPFQLKLGLVRLPDVSFIPWDRLPDGELPADPICPVIPTLAVEVLSPKNSASEIRRKLAEYFEAGVKLTWIIDPKTMTAKSHTSANRVKEIDSGGVLDGGKVFPGFKLPLADLFAATKRRKKKSR